jgi:CHAT domain-containing protein/Tfp pilus assembly protein PilF
MKDIRFAITRHCSLRILLLTASLLTTRTARAQPQPGIVVEKIATDSAAERAGVKEGDVLTTWSRGDAKGELKSPFDLADLEIEQAPRGTVTLEGSSGADGRVWQLGPANWGIDARPVLSGTLLTNYREGQDLAHAGKVHEALERWRTSTNSRDLSAPVGLRFWFLFRISDSIEETQDWQKADDAFQKLIDEAAEATKAQFFRAWAATFQQRGDWANAEKYYREAAAEIEKSGPESLLLADTFDDIGFAASWRGEVEEEEKYYSQALAIQQKLARGSLNVAKSLNGLGNTAQDRGDMAKSEEYHLQALEIREKLAPGSLDVARSLGNLGNATFYLGDLAKAEDYYNRALVIQQKLLPGRLVVALTLNNLGNVAWRRGDLKKSEKYHYQALALREKLAPDSVDVAMSFTNLGNIVEAAGDIVKAEEYQRQALAIYEKLAPGGPEHANALAGLGEALEEQGDLAQAERYCRQALAIREKLGPGSRNVALSLDDLGLIYADRGNLVKAEEYHRRALVIREKVVPGSLDLATTLINLGAALQRRGNLADAEKYYKRGLEIGLKLAPGSTLAAQPLAGMAGIMRSRHRLDMAAEFYKQALDAFEGQTAQLAGSEEVRSSFRAQFAGYYTDYMEVLLAQNQTERAFQVLERLRARTLLETLTVARADIRKGVDAALVETEWSLRGSLNAKSARRIELLGDKHTEAQLADLDREIRDTLKAFQDIEEKIRVTSPGYAALTQPQPLGASDVQQQLLSPDTLLLEYSLGEKRSYVFAVTPISLDVYPLPKRSAIEAAARHLYELLTARKRAASGESAMRRQARLAKVEPEYEQAVAELSRMLLTPVAGLLQDKRLLIVSDGALQYVPFAVLPTPSAGNSKTATPLVATHEIVNLPSASVLAILRREEAGRRQATRTVAVIADPVFVAKDDRVQLSSHGNSASDRPLDTKNPSQPGSPNTESDRSSDAVDLDRSTKDIGVFTDGIFPRLPFTRREADAIYSTTDKNDSLEALDFDASKFTALSPQMKDYRIVHFATHGLLNNDHPELSGLVFSLVDKQGNSQDGFLRMLDIYNMELNADLVVLSACQTALGKQIGEEGLIGLTRGFMYAGAPRVVASLWKVDDEATAALMKKFYEGMLREHQTPAQALRAAQQWMRTQKAWQSPYYWAGFILQGEWK